MKSQVREIVKEYYGKIPKAEENACCGFSEEQTVDEQAKTLGYSDEDIASVPNGANLGLGCGNPLAFSEIKSGETVLDLGSGAGFDCFLAAQEVGPEGRVIGVDMTPEMIEKANENKRAIGATNIEYRLGYIEDLPVESNSVDVVISNCVINLSPDKASVFREAFRVLKPGGRLMVSDIVLLKKLPEYIKKSVDAYVSCIAGASLKHDYLNDIHNAGFENIKLLEERPVSDIFPENDPSIQKMMDFIPLSKEEIKRLSGQYAESIKVRAVKPL